MWCFSCVFQRTSAGGVAQNILEETSPSEKWTYYWDDKFCRKHWSSVFLFILFKNQQPTDYQPRCFLPQISLDCFVFLTDGKKACPHPTPPFFFNQRLKSWIEMLRKMKNCCFHPYISKGGRGRNTQSSFIRIQQAEKSILFMDFIPCNANLGRLFCWQLLLSELSLITKSHSKGNMKAPLLLNVLLQDFSSPVLDSTHQPGF